MKDKAKRTVLIRPLHNSNTPLIRLAAASIGGLVLATFPKAIREGISDSLCSQIYKILTRHVPDVRVRFM